MRQLAQPSARGAPTRSSRTFRIRAAWWRHPEVSLLVVAAAAWIGLGSDHFAHHDQVASTSVTGNFSIIGWTAMVLAMMLPGVLPMARYVAYNSLWARRLRSMSIFVLGYVGVWIGAGIVGWAVLTAVTKAFPTPLSSRAALIIMGVVAVGWQFSGTKYRALRRCHLRLPLAARSTAADLSALRYGGFHGWACMGSCWAIMALMLVTHDFHLMIPLAVVTVVERYQTRPTGSPGAAAIAVTMLVSVV